ncbi:MAG: nucleotidyltransferase domain-containing protein [Nanoarchaeota archaeon]
MSKRQYNTILAKIIAQIKPKDTPVKDVKEMFGKIVKLLKLAHLRAVPELGGSFAKNTFIKGDHDIDIFVRFNQQYRDQDISLLLAKAIVSLKPEKLHGSRDYFHIHISGLRYEIVPVLSITKPEHASNITDFSPWHVAWVRKNGRLYIDDIRLAKKFCKSNKCYGAESYISGFSGHVLDILIIHYKGFLRLLQAASRWKESTIIDHYNVHHGKARLHLNQAKTQGPLILIDPVQPDRNAASALSFACYNRFIQAAKSFLQKPSKDYFTQKIFDPEVMVCKPNAVILKVLPLKAKEDKAGAKLVQVFEKIKYTLEPFGIKDSDWEWGGKEAYLWYVLKKTELSSVKEIKGPPLKLEEHAAAFEKKYPGSYIKKRRLYACVPRLERTPKKVIEQVQNYINERVFSITWITPLSKK